MSLLLNEDPTYWDIDIEKLRSHRSFHKTANSSWVCVILGKQGKNVKFDNTDLSLGNNVDNMSVPMAKRHLSSLWRVYHFWRHHNTGFFRVGWKWDVSMNLSYLCVAPKNMCGSLEVALLLKRKGNVAHFFHHSIWIQPSVFICSLTI